MNKEQTIRGFKCCMEHECYEDCLECPYKGHGCKRSNCKDMLELAENLQKDFEAALEDLKRHADCTVCLHFNKDSIEEPCKVGGCFKDGRGDKWQWRGRQEGEKNANR